MARVENYVTVSVVALLVGGIPTPSLAYAEAQAQSETASPPAVAATDAQSSSQASDTGLEDIVVTARKRAEDVQTVPLSVSAIAGTALERRGIANVRELSFTVPSLSLVGQNSARSAILQIRGIGSSGANAGIEPDVGVYFDGAYQKQAATVLQTNLLDIEAVEVLRGPQGTLYGRNTPVGAVIVRSRAPTQTPEAMIQFGAGNYDQLYVQGYAGGGLGETLAGRVSFFASHLDGYDYNITSKTRVNGFDQYGVRARLQWRPTAEFTADLIVFYNRLKDDCCVADNVNPTGPGGIATPAFLAAAQATLGRPYANLTEKDHIVDTAESPLEYVKTFGAQVNAQYDFANDLTLNSITAYSGTRMENVRGSSMMQPIVALNVGSQTPIDSISQELRLSSPADRRFAFQGGVYAFREKTSFDERRMTIQPTRVFADGTTLPPGLVTDFAFSQRTVSGSVYGQGTFNVTDAFRLTGGARFSHDNKRGSSVNVATRGASPNFAASFPTYSVPNLRFKESKVTWLASAQYNISPTVMVYGTYSTGWKSGGFNGRLTPVNAPLTFEAENAENYEAGLKSSFWGRKLLANISLYKLTVKGFQDSILNPVTGSGFIVGNAGDIHAKGVEADIQARPIPPLLISATLAYLSSEFRNYSAAPCFTGAVANGSRPGTCNLTGRRPAFSPEWRWSLSGEYTQPITDRLSAFVRGDLAYTGDQFTYAPLDPRSFQKGYSIVNARVGLEGPNQKWRFTVWAKNLTDKVYYAQVAPVANGAFLSAGGRAGVTSLVGWTGQPRTYGVEGSVKF